MNKNTECRNYHSYPEDGRDCCVINGTNFQCKTCEDYINKRDLLKRIEVLERQIKDLDFLQRRDEGNITRLFDMYDRLEDRLNKMHDNLKKNK